MLSNEWVALKSMGMIVGYIGDFKFGVDIGKFAGDVILNSSNTILRYYEVCAMTFIREAILKEIVKIDSKIVDKSDWKEINSVKDLLIELLYVNFRGEYCVYNLLKEDAGILSNIRVKFNGKSDKAWFETVLNITKSIQIKIKEFFPNWEYYKKKESIACEYEMRKEVIDFKLSDGTLYYSNTIEYPYFFGNSKVETLLNQQYYDLLLEMKSNEANYDEEYHTLKQLGNELSLLPYYDNTFIEVMYNQNGVISIKEKNVMWHGGMHEYHVIIGVTYDINTGKKLTLSDFIVGTDEEIDRVLYDVMANNFEYDINKNMVDILKKDTPYTLRKEGLCFYYNIGEALRRKEIIIPFTSNNYIISASELISQESIENKFLQNEENIPYKEGRYTGHILSCRPDKNTYGVIENDYVVFRTNSGEIIAFYEDDALT